MIVVDSVYDAFLQSITQAGGMLLDIAQTNHLINTHWNEGHLNRNMLAKDIDAVLDTLGFSNIAPEGTKFLVAPATILVCGTNFWRKNGSIFALYRASNFNSAKSMAREIHAYQGRGHS